MRKMKKKFLLGAAFSLLLVSCGTVTSETTTTTTTSSNDTGEVTSQETTSEDNKDSYEEVSVTPVAKGGISGVLTDISIGMNMFVSKSAMFSVSGEDVEEDKLDVSFSNPELVSYEYVGTSPTLHFLKAGNTSIVIKNAEGLIEYRDVIHVRNIKTAEELEDYLVSVDYYNTKFFIPKTTDLEIVFEPGNTALLNGEDYGSVMDGTTFDFSFVQDNPNFGDFGAYEFSVSNFKKLPSNTSTLNIKTLMINYDGSNMWVYDANLAAVMGPVVDGVNQYYMN